jgi:hypothetical protein
MSINQAANREMLRHTIATLAYRASKPLRDTPPGFADFTAPGLVKTPVMIVAHLSGLIEWALSMARGTPFGTEDKEIPLPWDEELSRFYRHLEALDTFLASDQALHAPIEKLFQGPIADALTHVGQLSMLRRMAGSPIQGENFFQAEITIGRVGSNQASSEF